MTHVSLKKSIILMLLFLSFLCLLNQACAKNADGSYSIGVDTIVAAMRSGQLVADTSASSSPGDRQKVAIPALPKGQIRLYGTFESGCGKYFCAKPEVMANMRGIEMFGDCPFGTSCHDGGWFYADMDSVSGEIMDARAYFYGNAPHNTQFFGDFRKKYKGSYGYVKNEAFAIGIVGETGTWDVAFSSDPDSYPDAEWPDWKNGNTLIVLRGKGNLLKAANGATFKYEVILDPKSLDQKIGKNIDCDILFVANGVAHIQRGK